jgi:macrolide transport system ATP-binding/permease protein
MIKINKVNFQIIGILPEKGGNSFRDQDDVIVIPLQTGMRRLLGRDFVDMIEVEMTDSGQLEESMVAINDILVSQHKIPMANQQDAFQIRNMAEIQQALESNASTMTTLLSAIAAISLLVGGIGIMNIMLVSVTERTREIGLRKAVGAKRRDILAQFLSESVVISVLGGAMGILVGWLMSFGMAQFMGWSIAVSWTSAGVAFFFSALIGIVFGVYPARMASQLNPIEALRYE